MAGLFLANSTPCYGQRSSAKAPRLRGLSAAKASRRGMVDAAERVTHQFPLLSQFQLENREVRRSLQLEFADSALFATDD